MVREEVIWAMPEKKKFYRRASLSFLKKSSYDTLYSPLNFFALLAKNRHWEKMTQLVETIQIGLSS